MRLVVDAVELQAAGEINQRLLLVERAQHFGGGLQRGQLAVGVEDVELAVVLSERGAGIGRAGVVVFVEALRFGDQLADRRLQQVAIVGEILQHLDGAVRVLHDRHQIGRSDLLGKELLRRRERAQLVGGIALMSK